MATIQDCVLFSHFIETIWQSTSKKTTQETTITITHKKTVQNRRTMRTRIRKQSTTKPKPVIVKNHKTGKSHREYFVNKIITHRVLDNGTLEYYVNWLGYTDNDNTWEPYRSFTKPDGSVTQQLRQYITSADIARSYKSI